MRAITARRITLFAMFLVFEMVVFLIGHFRPVKLDPFTWGLLVLASSLGGAAIAYMTIGEWIRTPVAIVVKHSSGVGYDTEPKYQAGPDYIETPAHYGTLEAIGELICCPICAGTWFGLLLYTLYGWVPGLGISMIYVLSIGGAVRLVVRTSEAVEWVKNLLWELTGKYNRENIDSTIPF